MPVPYLSQNYKTRMANQSRQSVPRQRRIQPIRLEAYDDSTSVRDRLQFVKAGRVLLIFPKNAKILQRKLDLVLVQREAARRDLRLAIVTQDFLVMDNAADLNISAFLTVEDARTRRWKRPRNKVFVDRRDRPESEHDPYELQRAATRLKPPLTPAQEARRRVFRGIIFGIAMLAVLFGMYATLPSARVVVTPAQDGVTISINMIADPTIFSPVPESLRIPLTVERRLEEATVTIETSGTRPAENSLAEGIVTFTNNTNLAQFISKGTIVQTNTAPPIQFETQEDAALVAIQGSTVNVAIRALATNPPLTGNQPPDAIVRVFGELGESISVRNQNATYGEGVREIALVTEFDHERLQTLASQQIRQIARDNLLLSLDESHYLPVTESIEIVEDRDFIYTADVNQPAQTISLTYKAVVETSVIDLNDARLVAFANLGKYVTEGRTLDQGNLDFRTGEIQQIFEDGTIAFQMRIEGTTYVTIEGEQIRERLTGLSAREARAVLENEFLLDPNNPPEINTWPGFLKRMPILPIRISVDIRDG